MCDRVLVSSRRSLNVANENLVVCLSFTVFHDERYVQRLRELPGVEPVLLPVDPDGNWSGFDSGVPQPEPPPWATSVAEERRAVLDRAHVLVALHSSEDLLDQMPELRWVRGSARAWSKSPAPASAATA